MATCIVGLFGINLHEPGGTTRSSPRIAHSAGLHVQCLNIGRENSPAHDALPAIGKIANGVVDVLEPAHCKSQAIVPGRAVLVPAIGIVCAWKAPHRRPSCYRLPLAIVRLVRYPSSHHRESPHGGRQIAAPRFPRLSHSKANEPRQAGRAAFRVSAGAPHLPS